MAYLLLTLCALLSAVSALLAWKILLMRRSAEEIRRGLQERLETDTNTLLSISSQDRAMRRLAAGLNSQLRLLRQERRRCQQGDRELKDAITNITHDLRTPLTAICGYLDLLEGEEMSEAAARYLACIRGRTDHLRELTEEFFRYSAVLSAGKAPRREMVSLNRAVEESLAAWYAVLTAKGITPAVALPEAQVVRPVDPEALRRVLSNVLSNAAKYSGGDLNITLEENGTLTFSNAAPSLTPVLAEKLFDRYFTVESGGQGTGIGLSIARHLMEQMDGSVTADWREGVLRVRLHFPAGEPPTPHFPGQTGGEGTPAA